MKKRHGLILLGLFGFGMTVPGLGAAPAPADFNQARLESGKYLFDEKRYREAIDQFRIAAFGFLGRPDWLSSSLARLALAQVADSRPEDADATLARFLEVQRRFPSYPPRDLEPERQAEFRALLLKRVQEATLLGIPSLAGLVETEEQKIARLAPAERKKALEAAARRDPSSAVWAVALAREAAERGDWKEAERWAGTALAAQPNNTDALALRARARVVRGELAQARADLNAIPPAELAKRPELYADVFVTGVEAGDWAMASEVSPRIPSNLMSRPDVAKAQQKLAAERQRRTAEAAPKTASATPARKRDRDPTGSSSGGGAEPRRPKSRGPRREPAARPRRPGRRGARGSGRRPESRSEQSGAPSGASRSGVPVSFLPRRGVPGAAGRSFWRHGSPLDVLRCRRAVRDRQGG